MSVKDSWNPMEDHYKSGDAHSYDSGPGAARNASERKIRTGTANPCKLWVRQIPDKLNVDALKNIFNKFGDVQAVYIHDSHYWGTVLFADKTSASEALQNLHNAPEYGFKISFYLENEKDAKFKKYQQALQSKSTNQTESYVRKESPSVFNKSGQLSHSPSSSVLSFTDNVNRNDAPRNLTNSLAAPQTHDATGLRPIPDCVNCGKRTLEQCKKCWLPFCTKKCMVLGYEHHTQHCITIANHTTDPEITSPLNGRDVGPAPTPAPAPMRNTSRLDQSFNPNAGMDEFQSNAQDYRRHQTMTQQNTANSVPRISNSYDNDDSSITYSRNVSKKTYSNAGDAAETCNTRTRSSFAPEKENRAPNRRTHDDDDNHSSSTMKSESNWSPRGYDNKDQNEVPKSESRPRVDYRNRYDGTKNDNRGNGGNRQGTRSQDDRSGYGPRNGVSRGDGRNGGGNHYGNRSYDDRNRNDRSSKSYEGRASEDVGGAVGSLGDEDIKFDSAPPKFSEKKKPTTSNAPNRRSEDGGRPSIGGSRSGSECPEEKRSSDRDAKCDPIYVTNRRSYKEGDKLEVRINEILTDVADFSSIRIVEEESMLPMLLADMMRETSLPPVTWQIGAKCLVCRDEERIRAIITSQDPLKVKYIDTGFCASECDQKIIKGCPEKYQAAKPFAYKVKFVNAQQVDLQNYKSENKIFEIRIVRKHKELVWEAEILAPFRERLEGARQQRASKDHVEEDRRDASKVVQNVNTNKSTEAEGERREIISLGKIVMEVDKPIKVYVTFIESDGKHFYIARHVDLQKLNNEIDGKTFPKLEDIRKDNLCLAPQEGICYRARIMETDPVKVHFLDFGNVDVISKDDLQIIPTDLSAIEPLATRVRLAAGDVKDFGIEDNTDHVLRPVENDVTEKVWVVSSEECFDVTVLDVLSDNEFYVMRDTDIPHCEAILKLPKTPLKSDPKVGSVYLIEYEGMNWRAELTSASPPTVKYIDYGNEEIITFDRLFELPLKWQQKDPMAFKINVPKMPSEQKIRIKAIGSDQWEILST